ncbi:MAG: GFA family protein [Chthoniobacterales bacterium]
MNIDVISGGCLCGAVRYEGRGAPYNVTHCHCADCRKSAGAPFVTWASFPREDFRFIRGEPRTVSWAGRLRSFCSDCGTSLTFLSGSDATEIDVTVASFDEAERVSPADHTWVCDQLSWIDAIDSLPKHHQQR